MFVTLLLLAAGSLSCDDGEPWKDPGPRDVFDAFLMHWFRGEAELAFDYILPEDRRVLVEPLEEVGDLDDEHRPQPHEMLVVADVDNVYDISKMEVDAPLDNAPEDAESVTVTLHHQDGSTAEAQLVWTEGRWYVDLPLKKNSTKKKTES